jgi:2-polyprenyl-3-methyl-5-hydroxy-6-metoxy-1,4-benzoquinol methylase
MTTPRPAEARRDELVERLFGSALGAMDLRDPPARVADVACGLGRSSIAIARAYPKVTVDGIDLDQASITRAQQLLPGSGVDDRVAFHCQDAASAELSGRYDLVTILRGAARHVIPGRRASHRTFAALRVRSRVGRR